MASQNRKVLTNVKYWCSKFQNKKVDTVSIDPIGIDTEAYNTGECFMICTSLGDTFHRHEFPRCLFSRRYRQQSFVAYNLKYDMGALLQNLPEDSLEELRKVNITEFDGFKYKVIANKCLTITRGKNSIHIYDIMGFYGGSLDYNSKKYLNKGKIEIETKTFTKQYVEDNWDAIAEYCIEDCKLTRDLALLIIGKFESFGVYPKKLYSTAYVTYQYFKSKCKYPTVRRFWYKEKKLLDFAMRSYNGGKFEVTVKGSDYLYEYDIVSAYPYEIRNLVDTTYARVVWSKHYRQFAVYGFLYCKMLIPVTTFSPLAIPIRGVNTYPAGYIEKVITKQEYDYLVSVGVDITIIEGVWLHVDKKTYPFRKEIDNLLEYKKKFKEEGKALDYKTIKIFLNSLYGKFVQLVDKGTHFQASSCWHPIYGSVITANTRIRITEMQQKFPSIIAVHTDSLISLEKLPIETGKELGMFDYETEGNGVVIGCGVYQIGDTTKIRGFHYKGELLKMLDVHEESIELNIKKVYSWREVIFHNWEKDKINRFVDSFKKLRVDSDRKRIWIKDYKTVDESLKRKVISLPFYLTESGI